MINLSRIISAHFFTALLFAFSIGDAGAAEPVVAKFGDVLYNHPCAAANHSIAADVSKHTGGGIQLNVRDGGQLGGSEDMADALVIGAVQLLQESPVFFEKYVPEYALADTAFIWRDIEHARSVLGGPIGQELHQKLLENAGVRALGYTYYGTRHLTANKPVRSMADIDGLRTAVPDGRFSIELFKAWGAVPAAVNFNELFQSLKQKKADAQENPLSSIASLCLWSVQKYVILTGHHVSVRGIYVNESWWQKLDRGQQLIVQAAVDKACTQAENEVKAQEKALKMELEKKGMKFITPDLSDMRQTGLAVLKKMYGKPGGGGYFERLTGEE